MMGNAEWVFVALLALLGGSAVGATIQREEETKKLRLFRRAGNDSIDAYLDEKGGK